MHTSFVSVVFLISAIVPLVVSQVEALNELDLFGDGTDWIVDQVPEYSSESIVQFTGEGDNLLGWTNEINLNNEHSYSENLNDALLLDTSNNFDSSNPDLFASANDHDCSLTPSQSSSSSSWSLPSRHRAREAPAMCLPKPEPEKSKDTDLAIMSEVQKRWCSETNFPWFQNIPVCYKETTDMFGYDKDPLDAENAYFANFPFPRSLTIEQGYLGMF